MCLSTSKNILGHKKTWKWSWSVLFLVFFKQFYMTNWEIKKLLHQLQCESNLNLKSAAIWPCCYIDVRCRSWKHQAWEQECVSYWSCIDPSMAQHGAALTLGQENLPGQSMSWYKKGLGGLYQIYTRDESSCTFDIFLLLLTETCCCCNDRRHLNLVCNNLHTHEACLGESPLRPCVWRVCSQDWMLLVRLLMRHFVLAAADINSGSRSCRRPASSSPSTTKLAPLCSELWSGRWIRCVLTPSWGSACLAFTRLSACLFSVLKKSPPHLVKEIILVDDYSDNR